jgi:serine/threonine protein kinase
VTLIVPKRLRRGASIGNHLTILRRLDRRGSDPVLLVWDHRSWCPAVCKVFRSKRRAAREMAALSTFDHPNIVRCLGIEPPSYVLLEHLQGPTLNQLLEKQNRGRLGLADAIRLTIHIAASLQHVHQKGFVHLDVKPDNVVIVSGRPVLFDFGSLRAGGSKRRSHVHGTDPYIAPEEWRGETVNSAADVFSLGVMLFEMLTGHLPFGPSTRTFSRGRAVPPKTVQHYRARISHKLEALVHQCLAWDAAARPTLTVLIPALHQEIAKGPRMWPKELVRSRLWRQQPGSEPIKAAA